MSDVDYKKCIQEADMILLSIDQSSFPLNLKKAINNIKNYNITVVKYSELINENLSQSNMLGNTIEENGKYFIEYNDQIRNEGRRRFTICHELGHIVLNHDFTLKNDSRQEAEANIFAAELLMPEAIIQEIVKRGYDIANQGNLEDTFKASSQAYSIRLEEYSKHAIWYKKSIEANSILLQFKDFLDKSFPNKKYIDYDIDAEEAEERERDLWRR